MRRKFEFRFRRSKRNASNSQVLYQSTVSVSSTSILPLLIANRAYCSARDFYAEKVSEAYAAEYRAVAEAYAAVVERGRLLGLALRIDIPTPALLSTPRVEIGTAATRISKTLNALDDTFRDIEKSRQSALRDSTRRKAFDPSATLEFLRQATINGEVFQTGQRVLCSVIGASMGERLYRVRSVKVV